MTRSWISAFALLVSLSPLSSSQETPETRGADLARSPRDVMERFLGGMGDYSDHRAEADLARATAVLEASEGYGAERAAEKLYDTLNRVEWIDLDALPAAGDPELADGKYGRTFGPPPDLSTFTMRLVFVRGEDEGWRISSTTIQGVSSWWAEVRELPELGDVPVLRAWRHRLRTAGGGALAGKAFLLENWQWVGLVLLALLAVVADLFVRFFVGRVVARATRSERIEVDASTLQSFERPVGFFVSASLFGALLPVLGLEGGAHDVLSLAAGFAATVAGVWAAYRLVDVFCGYLGERAAKSPNKFDDILVPLLRRTLKIVVVLVALVYLASKWTEDLWGVVAGLGIGSLAIGFAARDSIENLFGTFTVLMDKPFELGDWIIVGDLEGSVEEVGFRSTRIRTFYNSVITVPNRTFISSNVDNMGRRRYRRVKTMLALTYDTPPEKVEAFCEGVRELLRTHPYTRKDYYQVYLNALGAASLDVLLYAFLETPDWSTELREKHRLFADVLRVAERLNVSFAFPTQTLHVARPEDLEHPDRPGGDVEGARRGRDVAAAVVAETLAPFGGVGSKPPPTPNEVSPFGGDAPGDSADG